MCVSSYRNALRHSSLAQQSVNTAYGLLLLARRQCGWRERWSCARWAHTCRGPLGACRWRGLSRSRQQVDSAVLGLPSPRPQGGGGRVREEKCLLPFMCGGFTCPRSAHRAGASAGLRQLQQQRRAPPGGGRPVLQGRHLAHQRAGCGEQQQQQPRCASLAGRAGEREGAPEECGLGPQSLSRSGGRCRQVSPLKWRVLGSVCVLLRCPLCMTPGSP